jgi:hypothetical protein
LYSDFLVVVIRLKHVYELCVFGLSIYHNN